MALEVTASDATAALSLLILVSPFSYPLQIWYRGQQSLVTPVGVTASVKPQQMSKMGGLTQSDNAHDIFVSNDYCTMNRIRQLFSLPAAAFVWGRERQRKNSNLSGGPPRSPSIRTQMAVI